MDSVKCQVWSGKCKVQSAECGVWGVKCKVWSVEPKSMFSFEFSYKHRHCDGTKEASDSIRDMLEYQSEHFVRGFRRFPSHVTKCHASHRICTLSPLIGFTKNRQHDTSKVLRVPRKMTSEVSKLLRRPRKMQRIF